MSSGQLFRPSITQKPGIFQPVTGQAIVVVTTAVDQAHVDAMKRNSQAASKGGAAARYRSSAAHDVVKRVESHLVALKKKGSNRRHFRGTGADLKIFTAVNGLTRDELISGYEHVGIVQTPINPDDKTKPTGFHTNATRIGGTVSLINTGSETIPANVPVYWDAPGAKAKTPVDNMKESECGSIRGHPEGIIYPAVRPLLEMDEADMLYASRTKDEIKRTLTVRRRIIGWSINESAPGHQLDLILKK